MPTNLWYGGRKKHFKSVIHCFLLSRSGTVRHLMPHGSLEMSVLEATNQATTVSPTSFISSSDKRKGPMSYPYRSCCSFPMLKQSAYTRTYVQMVFTRTHFEMAQEQRFQHSFITVMKNKEKLGEHCTIQECLF